MNVIQVMFGIVLVFLFAGPLAAFLLGTVDAAQNAGARGAQINNTEAMTQFIMWATYTGYQCTPEAGGFEKGTTVGGATYWASWEEVRDDTNRHNDFEELNESYSGKSEFNCYGVENKLPLSQGAWEEAEEFVREDDFWINDQEGEYSKRDFTITEKNSGSDGVRLGPCVAYDEHTGGSTSGDFTFYVTDETVPNVIRYLHAGPGAGGGRRGLGMDEHPDDFGSGPLDGECMVPDESYTHHTDEGPIGTLTVIGADPAARQDSITAEGFADIGNPPYSDGHGWRDRDVKEWKLCPGTEGYIQINVGKNINEQGPGNDWNDRGSQYYSAEFDRLPGNPDIEAAGSLKANTIHPFIVITNLEAPDASGSC